MELFVGERAHALSRENAGSHLDTAVALEGAVGAQEMTIRMVIPGVLDHQGETGDMWVEVTAFTHHTHRRTERPTYGDVDRARRL